MYLYVQVWSRDRYYAEGPQGRVKARLEQASGERCLIIPYEEVSLDVVRELRPRAMAASGFGGHFQSMKVESFLGLDEVFHKADLPILCFCGSHQLLGFSFNRDLRATKRLADEPMRRHRPLGDAPRHPMRDADGDFSGFFKAEAFYRIRRVKADPLFRGLPANMIMKCAHYCEVKRLPPGFVRLAESAHCRIEAMRHRDRPLYGTQFHPEAFEAPFLHGQRLLENFARIVSEFWRRRDRRSP